MISVTSSATNIHKEAKADTGAKYLKLRINELKQIGTKMINIRMRISIWMELALKTYVWDTELYVKCMRQ